ncbi:hypothetical protein IWX75_003454 [Arthrobacter sp. CAN_A6]|uniref:RES domain-containing protein n=1 Tax=Arthrobacter sp. CAN_A6 TaxID=2787721 RepID=UPI0018C8F79A
MIKRRCAVTGLFILDGPVTMYRVAQSRPTRGPLNPLPRPDDPAIDRSTWNRFDTPGLTIYGADTRATAFTESIAYKAPSANDYAGLREIAQDQGIPFSELLEELRMDGKIVDGLEHDWRLERSIYTLNFPSLPWVDLAHPDTVVAIKASGIAKSDRMSLADLTGDNRQLTTVIAQWIRSQQLDDENYPAGIRYPSKFGLADGDYCYAGFLNKPNKGAMQTSAGFTANDSDLLTAITRTGVAVA